jgi:UDP-N-acetylmuramyl pentapeptide phosphotransferase/UDP-N-acetylglucosamine-1-phosphate transferase
MFILSVSCISLIFIPIIRDYYMTFSISAQVLARDSHIKPDSEAGGLIWVEG